MQTKKYFMFSCCNHALRVFKTFSIKLMAYVMQQHLLLATFYYSMLTILFWSGHNDITDEHFDEHYFWYVSEDSKKTKKKIWQSFSNFFLGFSCILRIIWNLYIQKKICICCMRFRTLRIFWNGKIIIRQLWKGGGSACRSPCVLFRPKHEGKLPSRFKNKFCRLLNIKRRLSVIY